MVGKTIVLLVLVPAVVLSAANYCNFLVFNNLRSNVGLSSFVGDATALGQAGSKLGLFLIPGIILEFVSIGVSF